MVSGGNENRCLPLTVVWLYSATFAEKSLNRKGRSGFAEIAKNTLSPGLTEAARKSKPQNITRSDAELEAEAVTYVWTRAAPKR
jgi:hypothetical protein